MPHDNAFRHQDYADASPDLWEIVVPGANDVNEQTQPERLQAAGRQMSDAGVRLIYVVHGTLVGTDVSGVLGELGRIWPTWSNSLKSRAKRLVDGMVGTTANYDESFENTLRDGLNGDLGGRPEIEVRRFFWSSQNFTLGRAEAAIELLNDIYEQTQKFENADAEKGSRGENANAKMNRVQVWGHSHAGNVFAILTNLLGGSVKSRAKFFRAARSYYRKPGTGRVDVPSWMTARKLLVDQGNPLSHIALDIVNFGTPIRYGWDTGGYDRLLHFTNHIPTEGLPEHRVPFPPTLDQVNSASAGDFVQQFFIAGTNFPPTIFALRSWSAERRLMKLIQRGHRARDLWVKLKRGYRIADEGKTLLVEYRKRDEPSSKSFSGHGVYTKRRWLGFHASEIVRALYS